MKKYFVICMFLILIPTVKAQRGCCSWHGGVSHCADNGRYVCNDGTYSPSCTCTPKITYKYGCTNSNAINYDSSANRDDGSCVMKVLGCTNPEAINYNSKANRDDGSCIMKVLGCTRPNAINYNSNANTADGSCQYESNEVVEEEISYETKTITGNKNRIKQEGKVGKKQITTKIIKDEQGNIISSDIVDEKITEEPIDEIIEKKATSASEENKKTSDTNSESNIGIFGIGLLGTIGYIIYRKKLIKKIPNIK